MAKQLYVSESAVSKWEKGDSIPDIETLEKLSKFYEVTIEELLNGSIKEKVEYIKKEENADTTINAIEESCYYK